jgi:beta-glucosidase
MRVGIAVAGIVGVAAVIGCQGPEVFRLGQGSFPPATGGGGIGGLPVLTSDVAGTSGAAAGTTGAAGTGAAGTGAAGTAAAGTSAPAAAGTGGAAPNDGGVAGTGPRDAAPEAPPAAPYATTGWKATASITAAGAADVATNAFDGEIDTRWATGRNQAGNETFTIDLGATRSLSRVVLDATTHPADFPVAYVLEVSTNGTAFTMAAMGKGSTVTDIQFTSRMARHVRIRQTGTTPAPAGAWWSIDEIKIYP